MDITSRLDRFYLMFDGDFHTIRKSNQSGDAGYEFCIKGRNRKVWGTFWAETKIKAVDSAIKHLEELYRKNGKRMGLHTLAKKLVLNKYWKWMPGMQVIVVADSNEFKGYTYRITEGTGPVNSVRAYPDLTDPATLGCLLHLVRLAWNDVYIGTEGGPEGWAVEIPNIDHRYEGDTEAEALIEALDAAVAHTEDTP